MVLGAMVMTTRSESHGNEDFQNFPNVTSTSCSATMKQNIYKELLGCSFSKIYRKECLPDPPDPKWGIYLDFSRIVFGFWHFALPVTGWFPYLKITKSCLTYQLPLYFQLCTLHLHFLFLFIPISFLNIFICFSF